MAECTVARCVQERRALRRELHKWGKDILLLVGFESIAEGLLGEESWSTFTNYTFEEKSGYATDWIPENICCFCNLRKCPPPDPARGICPVDGVEDNDPNYDQDGHYLYGSCPSVGGDQPLDLSMGSKSKAHTYWALMAERQAANSDGACPSLLKVPQLPTHPGKLKRRLESLACKRSYTDDELQAALRDIRSGRLGTRRAAVIYGIPRSTLRNKVYKLALESGLNVPVKHRGPSPVKVEVDVDVNEMGAPASTADTLVANKPEETRSVSESLRNLIRNRMVERAAIANAATNININSQSTRVANNRATANGNGWLRSLQPLLSRVLTNVQHFTTEREPLGQCADSVSGHPVLLPNLIRRLAEERFQEERRRVRPLTNEVHAPKVTTANIITPTNTNNVILKIPSYKPTKNCCVSVGRTPTHRSSQVITPVKKQVVAKDVTRRVTKKDEAGGLEEEEEDEDDCDDDEEEEEDDEREDDDDDEDEDEDEDNDGLEKGRKVTQMDRLDKRIRPKRGRYRNYQKADLAEAVRAVRRGQMSVHRAGSYFGVPHSTLEYKVKERHLLRSRKCKRVTGDTRKNRLIGGGTQRKDTEVASSCCSSNSSSLSGGEAVASSGGAVGGGGGNKCGVEPGTSLWPSGQMLGVDLDLNSENFFASQMMKKLQQDARLSQEQHKQQQGSYAMHDTLLLSVLLRSGLAVQPKRSSSSTNSSLSSSSSTNLPHQSPSAHVGKNCSAQV